MDGLHGCKVLKSSSASSLLRTDWHDNQAVVGSTALFLLDIFPIIHSETGNTDLIESKTC